MNRLARVTKRLLCACLFAAGCTPGLYGCSVQRGQADFPTGGVADARWAVLPFLNHSETPLAAERVEALVVSAMRARSLANVEQIYAAQPQDELFLLLDDRARFDAGFNAARAAAYDYGITGSVEEWRYKTGLDGEPAVGVTIRVVNIASGDTLWSSSGARSGWSRESLTGTGLKVIHKLLQRLQDEDAWARSNKIPSDRG